ncbi:restriction endonuclease subunit S [Zunongwangia sp.]|uniref:restriction endonuclease subunit S n=1 Tax=Zunongwangia sp. TaxID=1965325 RepID=UPI003AA9D4B4
MSVFKEYKLDELYEIGSGLSKSADQFGFGQPFLSFSDVFWNYFVPEKLSQLVNSNEKEQLNHSVKKGDVFLTRTSETIEELGMSTVALKDYPNATFNGFTKRLRPKTDDVVHPRFIGYYLRSPYFRAEVTAYSTLTTRASLNNGIIERLKVKLPSFELQKKIASILSAYDDLIENNNRRIQLLEEMASEIYKEWFVRLRFPGYENIVYRDKDGKEIDRENADAIPYGWKNGVIGDFVEFKKGKNITKNTVKEGNIPVVAGGLTPAYFHNKANTKSPTMTISASGANAGFVNLYYENIWASDCSYLDSTMSELFYYFYLTLKTRQKEIFHLQRGAAQPHVYPNDIMGLDLVFPDKNTVYDFEELIQPFMDEIGILQSKNQVLQETRDLLLPRLISGKLSVEHLLDEERLSMAAEPAAVYETNKE